jgi:phosphatidylglycerol:prolipoprotein diacylglycerol transferase
MHPVICKIGPFTVYSYGLMLAVAFFVGASLAARQARKENVDPDIIFNLCFISFISGVAGGRIFYVVENLSYYLKNPLHIFMLQEGGLAWFGGLITGVFCGILYLKAKKISVYKALDIVAPYLALAQAIGRIGCLLNGCCFGRTRIPVQIYASLLLFSIFIALKFLQGRPHWQGKIFFSYLLLYSIKRFFIEFLRVDNPKVFLGLTLFQGLSIVIFCIAAYKLIRCRNTA